MKTSKFLAGLLSAAMLTSFVPQMVMAAEEMQGVDKSDYIFFEDFEDEYNEAFHMSASNGVTAGYWHNEIATDETGNKYIKYWRTPASDASGMVTNGVEWSGDYRTVMDVSYNAGIKLDGTKYEVGYKFDPQNTDIYFNSLFTVSATGNYGRNTDLVKGNVLRKILKINDTVVAKNVGSIDGYADSQNCGSFCASSAVSMVSKGMIVVHMQMNI